MQLLRDTLALSGRWCGQLAFLGYLGLGALVGSPELVLVAAIVAGVALPAVFGGREPDDEP